ncbi:MAG: twin-arginine translocase TatA/TatE family subunit [Conexivisphaerales archaeon]
MFESVWDWIIVILVALLLFGGASKVPQLARAFGRAVGEFRKGQMEVERELRSLQEGGAGTQLQTEEEKKRRIAELQKELDQLRAQDSQNGK